MGMKQSVSAGVKYNVQCQIVGARPKPKVTWWLGQRQIHNQGEVQVRLKQIKGSGLDRKGLILNISGCISAKVQ